jgi:hypothetical protein
MNDRFEYEGPLSVDFCSEGYGEIEMGDYGKKNHRGVIPFEGEDLAYVVFDLIGGDRERLDQDSWLPTHVVKRVRVVIEVLDAEEYLPPKPLRRRWHEHARGSRYDLAMTQHKRIMSHVREYLTALGGRRESPKTTVSFDIENINSYAYVLEQITVGVESHAAVLREMRRDCFSELDRIERKKHANPNALNWYENTARSYVLALESFIAGEGVSDKALWALKAAYNRRRSAIRQAR